MSRIQANRSSTSMVSVGRAFGFKVFPASYSLFEPCRAAAPALPRAECIANMTTNNRRIGDQ
jgi:hypothetical protein